MSKHYFSFLIGQLGDVIFPSSKSRCFGQLGDVIFPSSKSRCFGLASVAISCTNNEMPQMFVITKHTAWWVFVAL